MKKKMCILLVIVTLLTVAIVAYAECNHRVKGNQYQNCGANHSVYYDGTCKKCHKIVEPCTSAHMESHYFKPHEQRINEHLYYVYYDNCACGATKASTYKTK